MVWVVWKFGNGLERSIMSEISIKVTKEEFMGRVRVAREVFHELKDATGKTVSLIDVEDENWAVLRLVSLSMYCLGDILLKDAEKKGVCAESLQGCLNDVAIYFGTKMSDSVCIDYVKGMFIVLDAYLKIDGEVHCFCFDLVYGGN